MLCIIIHYYCILDEVEVVNIEDNEECVIEEVKKAVPTTQQEKTLLKISYSPTKG